MTKKLTKHKAKAMMMRGSRGLMRGSLLIGAAAALSSVPRPGRRQTELVIRSEAAMEAVGAALGAVAAAGDVVLLSGDMGAGKSVLARGFVRARLGAPELRVTSPTYLLDNAYEADDGLVVHHMDLYRLVQAEAPLYMLGWPQVLEDCCLIEWPDRLGAEVPASRLDVVLTAPSLDTDRLLALDTSTLRDDHPWLDVIPSLEARLAHP